MKQDRLKALCMISIEKELIISISDFHRKVMDVFSRQKDRRMNFIYKLIKLKAIMKKKEKIQAFYQKIDDKFFEQFGFKINDVTFEKLVDYMYKPKDSSSLAVTRILFGLAMLFDIPDERGGASMHRRWGEPSTCHFPLLPILTPVGLPYMALVYAVLWLGALCIMLGYKFRIAAPLFTASYWYLFLIDKSFWNNHSYLFGLVALLLSCTDASCYWSLDAYLDPTQKKTTVPYWNYFVLKYQFFILYFMAGLKKGTAEWLTGYSVQNLSEHWVFNPFKYFLTVPQTDYLVVHWFVFAFDLTVALWMMWASSRHVAMLFCAMFHLMNSRLFRIGMFPWVCLATMPLFYPFDWPKRIAAYAEVYFDKLKHYVCNKIYEFKRRYFCSCKANDSKNEIVNDNKDEISKKQDDSKEILKENSKHENKSDVINEIIKSGDLFLNSKENNDEDDQDPENKIETSAKDIHGYDRKKVTIYLIMLYVFIQAFLPYSHFITKGYNNWTNGLYGYSWDMMVHTWDISSVIIKVVDNDRNEEMYIDPQLYTLNDRWSRHGDMVIQYAHCLKNNLERAREKSWNNPSKVLSTNISVYVDVWCSMNGRFIQRMFDPNVDLLKASWSPFCKVSYLMPLLDEAVHWRKDMDAIRNEVHSWTENSDVVFFADFPGYDQEKYIPVELKNISLTILEGHVVYEPEVKSRRIGQSFELTTGNRVQINSGTFHKVINIGEKPAFYMYTFFNGTDTHNKDDNLTKYKLPLFSELFKRFTNMMIFSNLLASNLFQLLLNFSYCSS